MTKFNQGARGARGAGRLSVWLLTNAPSSYQMELFQAMAGSTEAVVQVRYMRDNGREFEQIESLDPAAVKRMMGVGPRSWGDGARLHPRALWECAVGRYDCYVLSGLWTSMTFFCCAVLLCLRRRPWVLWLERPHGNTIEKFATLLGWLYPRLRSFLLRRAAAVFCIGTAARDAYEALGVPHGKTFILPYCVDTGRFQSVDHECVAALRQRYGLGDKTVLLFSGQMIRRKGVDTLLRIFRHIAEHRANVALMLLGDGPEMAQYEAMVPYELRSDVHFAGFIPQGDLPEHFAAADLFVFPSRHDGWGVVVNEACAAGLPVVVSEQTGAAHDLVEDGQSGFVLDAEDVDGFVERLLCLIDDPALRRRHGRRSRELVAPFSAANGAALFAQHLRQVLACEGTEHSVATDLRHVS